jgi:2-oxoglutarate ferredoxin oxidoreductase subunit gamma
MTRTEVKISGYGGQGVLTLGALITNTSIMYTDNLNASQSESYGAAARGGACWSEVVVEDSPEEINYPRTNPKNVDVGIFLTDEAVSKYLGEIKREGGIVIYDPSSVGKIRTKSTQLVYSIPAQQMARENLKNPLTANVIMFGAFTAITEIFDKESALKGVKTVAPPKAYDINVQAFNVGYDFALEQKKNLKKAS